MINSRDIKELTPDTQAKCREFQARCKAAGIDTILTSTYRDNACQSALYAQGRTTPGKRVTKAGPGHSYHNWRCAFDFVPLVAGKAIWKDDLLWAKCGSIAKDCGLEWGGDWRFVDKPHCQNTGGVTIAMLLAGGVVLA